MLWILLFKTNGIPWFSAPSSSQVSVFGDSGFRGSRVLRGMVLT